MNIAFSINHYDKDGDKIDDCIHLHFDELFILRVSDLDDIQQMIKQLEKIREEIQDL